MFRTKVVEIIKTHILCSITLFRKSCRLWDSVKKYGKAREVRGDNIIRRMHITCWINKAAFPLRQWLRERASMLRLYVHYLSCLFWIRCLVAHIKFKVKQAGVWTCVFQSNGVSKGLNHYRMQTETRAFFVMKFHSWCLQFMGKTNFQLFVSTMSARRFRERSRISKYSLPASYRNGILFDKPYHCFPVAVFGMTALDS